jgi:hypothetical protein
VTELLSNQSLRAEMGTRGRAVIDRNRGALEKLMLLIDSLLDSEWQRPKANE